VSEARLTLVSSGKNAAAASAGGPSRRHRAWISRNHRWLHLILIPLALLWMIPIIMVIAVSLVPSSNPATVFFGIFPAQPSFSNFVLIFQENPIFLHLLDSLAITVPSVALVVVFGSMAAFALARLRVPLKAIFFGALILALVLPISSIVVATFKILQSLNLYNSLVGLVLVYSALGLPFAVIVIRTAFLAIPYETYEAAIVDGANNWQIFWRIYFPLARPAIAVVVIWQIMMTWNDFLLPLVTLSDDNLKPLTLIPLAYQGTFLSQPGALFAILVVISIPVVVVFVLLQKYLVNGLAGAIK
jgi:raffinose/stachyose/melibiose transport system permease protein